MYHILAESDTPPLFYERKIEKMARVLVRAGGMKLEVDLTSALLWLCFGMTVHLGLVFRDEFSSFRK